MEIEAVNHAFEENVAYCIQFVFSMLVWPPALATCVILTHRSIKKGQLVEALPLLFG
jgi:hypothetical protein